MTQLPEGAVGVAVGVFIYAFINLACACLMIWMFWVHNERLSYVAFISYFVAISVVASMIQQIHDYVFWKDVVTEQFEGKKRNPSNPEIAIANGSVGMDLVLYYIQYYAYAVEAMFVLFWAIQLAQSVYGLSEKSNLKRALRIFNNVGKGVAIVLPLITILTLRAPAVQKDFIVFILIADLPLMLSMAIGFILVLFIIGRYVQSRRRFINWSANNYYGRSTTGASSADGSVQKPRVRKQSVYDRWLLVRFTVAFVILGVFEMTNTLFQVAAQSNNKKDADAVAPDFSVDRAKSTILLFMPGVTPGIVVFVVFGTTKTFRDYMYRTFVPKRWQRTPDRGSRMLAGSPASQDVLNLQNLQKLPHGPPPGNINVQTHISIQTKDYYSPIEAEESMGVKLQDLERGAVESHSSDERPILPIMHQAHIPRDKWR